MDPQATPCSSRPHTEMERSPTPPITATPATSSVTGSVRSTLACAQIRTPSMPTSPNNATPMPPTTPGGMVLTSADTLGMNASTTAHTDATTHAAVDNTFVAAIRPVFAGYAVVPMPPDAPASAVANPLAINASPMLGSRSCPLSAATAL